MLEVLNKKEEYNGMSLIFYPHIEDADQGNLLEKIELLMHSAEKYKAFVLDIAAKATPLTTPSPEDDQKRSVPRDLLASFNWDAVARALREVRDLPEISAQNKAKKIEALTKLAEVYEVLRGAKMPKLEAVRLALVSEATQLRGSSTQVA